MLNSFIDRQWHKIWGWGKISHLWLSSSAVLRSNRVLLPSDRGALLCALNKRILLANKPKDGYSSSEKYCPSQSSRNPQWLVQLSATVCWLFYMSEWKLSNTQSVGCHWPWQFIALQIQLRLGLHLLLQKEELSWFWEEKAASANPAAQLYCSAERGIASAQVRSGQQISDNPIRLENSGFI